MSTRLYTQHQTTSFPIAGDIRVTAPASARLMTPFVLQEQGDWFEDEIAFIRAIMQPGMQAIDIGANYGLYTLTIAKGIGESGKLWAFEPTAFTADCLSASLDENFFRNVDLVRAGLSDRLGKARLFTTPNSELNSLTKAATPGTHSEPITLLTLDHCRKRFDWRDIDFIKLDAEGEEARILKKGKSTLDDLSPLIMFEVKHGQQVNLPLIQPLLNLGYETYRLLPALNCLVPFSIDADFDNYLLNLFCCKEDRAIQLETKGFLVRRWSAQEPMDTNRSAAHFAQLAYADALRQQLGPQAWRQERTYLEVVHHAALAQLATESMALRCGHLMGAWQRARELLEKGERDVARLVTIARIAFDVGERNLGMQLLNGLIQRFRSGDTIEINEPLFPACQCFDQIAPHGVGRQEFQHWLFASILTQFVEKHAYSSYFSGRHVLPHLYLLEELGYLSDRLQTRRRLIELCFPA